MTIIRQIAFMLGLASRSFGINTVHKQQRPDISEKRRPPRSMTPEEKEFYDKHKHLNYSQTNKQ